MRDKAVRQVNQKHRSFLSLISLLFSLQVLDMFNFDGGRRCLIGEAWLPSNRVDDLANALR